jgi:hypothetical protein
MILKHIGKRRHAFRLAIFETEKLTFESARGCGRKEGDEGQEGGYLYTLATTAVTRQAAHEHEHVNVDITTNTFH